MRNLKLRPIEAQQTSASVRALVAELLQGATDAHRVAGLLAKAADVIADQDEVIGLLSDGNVEFCNEDDEEVWS